MANSNRASAAEFAARPLREARISLKRKSREAWEEIALVSSFERRAFLPPALPTAALQGGPSLPGAKQQASAGPRQARRSELCGMAPPRPPVTSEAPGIWPCRTSRLCKSEAAALRWSRGAWWPSATSAVKLQSFCLLRAAGLLTLPPHLPLRSSVLFALRSPDRMRCCLDSISDGDLHLRPREKALHLRQDLTSKRQLEAKRSESEAKRRVLRLRPHFQLAQGTPRAGSRTASPAVPLAMSRQIPCSCSGLR